MSLNYSSASSYGEAVNGSVMAQGGRVFDTSGPYANVSGNTSIGAQGQNAFMPGVPTSKQMELIQSGGRRSKSKSKSKSRGGRRSKSKSKSKSRRGRRSKSKSKSKSRRGRRSKSKSCGGRKKRSYK